MFLQVFVSHDFLYDKLVVQIAGDCQGIFVPKNRQFAFMELPVDDFVEVEQFCVVGIGGFGGGAGGGIFGEVAGF